MVENGGKTEETALTGLCGGWQGLRFAAERRKDGLPRAIRSSQFLA
jgi:hypothetical protein